VLQVGDRAPDFTGVLADGTPVRLKGILQRHHAVLYFFPKDFTPGCTREACAFRDHRGEIAALGGEIYGVSLDSAERHAAFAEQYQLPFPLISDGDGAIARAYGVLRLGGWLLTKRVTFVIDRDGVVRHVTHSELSMDRHVDEAIAALRALGAGASGKAR
jgi:peroxiredoxin Q/BCP